MAERKAKAKAEREAAIAAALAEANQAQAEREAALATELEEANRARRLRQLPRDFKPRSPQESDNSLAPAFRKGKLVLIGEPGDIGDGPLNHDEDREKLGVHDILREVADMLGSIEAISTEEELNQFFAVLEQIDRLRGLVSMSTKWHDFLWNVTAQEGCSALPSNFSGCILSSPPFDDTFDYAGHWHASLGREIATELYRIARPGSVLCWMVRDQIVDGRQTGETELQVLAMMQAGWWKRQVITFETGYLMGPSGYNFRKARPPIYLPRDGGIPETST